MAFKENFSKLTRSLSENASSVVQKSNDIIEISRLKGEIDNEEKKKNIIYMSIGKIVYDSYINKTELSVEIKNKCEDIIEHNEQIKNINGKIANVKKIKKCSNCGIDLSIDINFCPSCGNKYE
jgi:hypothetical protein